MYVEGLGFQRNDEEPRKLALNKSNLDEVDKEECASCSKQAFCWKSPIIRHYSHQH